MIKLKYCKSSWALKGYLWVNTLMYVVNAVVHCSISVTWDGLLFIFLVTLIAEFSRVNVKISSSSNMLRFLGNNFDRSKSSPLWTSFTYNAGMSLFGTENDGSCGDSVLSQSGFGLPGKVVCRGGSVAPVGFVSLCGVVPTATEFWFPRAVTVARAASVVISRLDSVTLSAIMVLSVSTWSAEESCKLPWLRVVVYTRHLVLKNEMILPLIWVLTGFGVALRQSTSWYWMLTISLLVASFPRWWHDDR